MGQLDKKQIQTFVGDLKYKIHNLTSPNGEPYVDKNIKPKDPKIIDSVQEEEIVDATMTILTTVYGKNNSNLSDFIEKTQSYRSDSQLLLSCCLGKLNAIERALKNGLLTSIEKQISGEVFSDFINAAKASSNEGQKDIAAVLACAALEDLLKRVAILNGLDVDEKTMSDVVNILRSNSIIKGAQSKLIGAYVTLRNKAFHADWDKIAAPEVNSLITFTEGMLLQHFS